MNDRLRVQGSAILTRAGRIAISVIFLYTGFSKIKPQAGFPWSIASVKASLAMFAFDVEAYKILPAQAISAAAHFLPFFEIAVGFWLLIGIASHISELLSAVTFLMFFSAQLSVYLRDIKIGCGCDLIPGEQVGPLSLTIDAALFLTCLGLTVQAFRANHALASQAVTGVQ